MLEVCFANQMIAVVVVLVDVLDVVHENDDDEDNDGAGVNRCWKSFSATVWHSSGADPR